MSDEVVRDAVNQALNDINDALPLRRLRSYIESLDLSADAKALLRDTAMLTVTIGGRLIAIGRKIVSLAIDLCSRFPNTIFGCVIAFIMSSLIASVPLLGPVLGAVLTPLLLALGIGKGALSDMLAAPIRAEVRAMSERLAALESGA